MDPKSRRSREWEAVLLQDPLAPPPPPGETRDEETASPKRNNNKNPNENDDDDDDDLEFDDPSMYFVPGAVVAEFQWHVVRKLMWDDSNHWKVLTQMYGSVWPRVIPYCLFNVATTALVWSLKQYQGLDVTVNPSGHKYAATLMSFLLVTRLSFLYAKYMENAQNLSALFRNCRDLVSNLCLLTANERRKRAKQWRQDVTYSTLVLLRVMVGVLQFQSNPDEHAWRLPEFLKEHADERSKYSYDAQTRQYAVHVKRQSQQQLYKAKSVKPKQSAAAAAKEKTTSRTAEEKSPPLSSTNSAPETTVLQHYQQLRRLAHLRDEDRKEVEEVGRAPFALAWNVRTHILKQRDGTWFHDAAAVWAPSPAGELRLLDFVGAMLKAYSRLFKNITTPIPFPLVQMNQVFLYAWILTVPLVLVHDNFSAPTTQEPLSPEAAAADDLYRVAVPLILAFVITFGFLGVEFVSVELTDNFGLDPSDFDALGFCHICMEDCYVSILQQDGKAWAHALRKRLEPKPAQAEEQTSAPQPPERGA